MQALANHAQSFQRTYADVEFRIVDKDEIDAALVHSLVDMNRHRLSGKGTVSGYDTDPQRESRLLELLRECGFGAVLYADGKLVAGVLCSVADTDCFCDLVGLDQEYGRFSPGMICLLQVIEECVRRGHVNFHMGWGTDHFKQRLGAHAEELWTVTVYRCRRVQLRHWREIAAVKANEGRRALLKTHYAVRHRIGSLIKRCLVALGWWKAKASEGPNDLPVANETNPNT